MPKQPKPPTLRLHPTGVYFVEWGKKVRYLSAHKPTADALYPKELAAWAAWVASAAQAPTIAPKVEAPIRNPQGGMTVAQGLQRFLTAKGAELDKEGLRHYKKNLGRLTRFMGKQSLASLTPSKLQDLKEELSKTYSPKTTNHTILSVRSMMKLLAGLGLCERIDYSAVNVIALEPPPPKGMSLGEVQDFIAKGMDARDQIGLACLLQFLTGMRASELPRIINGDGVWEAENVFRFNRHKTGKKAKRHRYIVLSPMAMATLKRLKPKQWANGHYYGIAVARIMGEGPGRLRHTAASILVRNGVSRAEVDEWLGHSVGRVSLTYIPPVEMFEQWGAISAKLQFIFAPKKKKMAA